MKPKPDIPHRNPARSNARTGFENVVLRLVKDGPERLAIETGQIDAVIDTASGSAILLPEAQRALTERSARFRSLVALCSDWSWEQDDHYCFTAHGGTGAGGSGFDDAQIIGKSLWEMPFLNMNESDWRTHRSQLEWRAIFQDLELEYVDRAGGRCCISINGEPVFDGQERFKGYRGTARNVTARKLAEALVQGVNRHARSALDALAHPICVLDPAGTVLMANKAWNAGAVVNGSLGTGARERANYLAICDNAVGNERADGIAIAAGIRRVITGQSSLFSHEYACDSPAGPLWSALTVSAYDEDGETRAVVSRENITARRQAEQLAGLDYTPPDLEPGAKSRPANRVSVGNSLLAALPYVEYQRLLAGMEPVTLSYGELLYAPGMLIRHVYFPIDCLVSLHATVDAYRSLEVGLIGHEGMLGIPLPLGVNISPVRALVLGTGMAMRMDARKFRKALLQNMSLQRILNVYAHTLMTQFAQTAACNHFHELQERLASRLLMIRDRVKSNEFRLTQDVLAKMLGVRRSGVSSICSVLQKRKLISYSRGNIEILDWKGLKATACSCYQILRDVQF